MKFKTVMSIKVIVCLGFGPLLLFVPGWFLELHGSSFGQGAAFIARLYGAALIGNFLLTWLARNTKDSTARRAINWHLCVYDAIGLVVTLSILLGGGLNLLGWGIVLVYLFFTLGFGYQLIKKNIKALS